MFTETAVATGLRVLIAEDDLVARDTMVEALAALSHDVVAAVSTGEDATAQALALSPDAVLLDVHLPSGSGIAAAEAINALLPGIGVVLISGDDSIRLSDAEALSTGAVAFLPKPTPPQMLDATLRLAAARANALREARRDAATATEALENRKIIEKAKGVLMRRTGCSEPEAYRILQRSSQDRSKPMVEIARTVLESEPGA
ncbi:MAG: ANTAR domain-containing protein [Gemmatimonadaceae bacterium]|nr:ANTAR domain-containing protein [Gemmatimonadaceae bacterium]